MRNIKRSIEQYKDTFGKKNDNEGAFYLSDVQQLLDMSNSDIELVSNALRAGFMIGYRKGRKHK
jgi:hypothetical protein